MLHFCQAELHLLSERPGLLKIQGYLESLGIFNGGLDFNPWITGAVCPAWVELHMS